MYAVRRDAVTLFILLTVHQGAAIPRCVFIPHFPADIQRAYKNCCSRCKHSNQLNYLGVSRFYPPCNCLTFHFSIFSTARHPILPFSQLPPNSQSSNPSTWSRMSDESSSTDERSERISINLLPATYDSVGWVCRQTSATTIHFPRLLCLRFLCHR